MNEQTDKKQMEVRKLLALAGSLNSILDLDYLLQRLGDCAEELLDCEASSIMLLDASKKFLYFKVATGEKGSALKRMTLPLGQGIAGLVAQNRETIIVNDTRKDPRFATQFDKASGFITRQLLAVPMVDRGELVGVVEVLNRKNDKPFSDDDVEILKSLAGLASVAISNTKLIQDQKNFFSHVLELLVSSIEISAPNMESHPTHSAYLMCAVAKRLGIEDPLYRYLYYAGLLHDIGYIGLKNRRVLRESGGMIQTLPPEQRLSAMSVKMLDGINIFQGAMPIIRHRHENFDGTGFPDKLAGETIPLGARVARLILAMEELRMTGGFKGQELRERAIREANEGSGKRFDPQVVKAFTRLIEEEEAIWEL